MGYPPSWIYKRHGQPLLSWKNGPPNGARAGEVRSLGSLGDEDTLGNPRGLPRPGAPEYIGEYVDVGAWDAPPSSSPPIRQRGVGDVTMADVATPMTMAGSALGAYHGYKRTGSVGWALLWAVLGGASPLITTGVALAQGFGKPKAKKP